MAEGDSTYLELFAGWLGSLGQDAAALGDVVAVEALPIPVRESVAGALNYLFKSLDLIPDGVDDIGYLDDAFVLRVACAQAVREDLSALEAAPLSTVNRLADEADQVRAFLDQTFPRLAAYVTGLRRGAARGRSVADILDHKDIQAAFLADVGEFAGAYSPPAFGHEDKNLVKLRAFFAAKLPKVE